jgi:hypothetical protein
MIMQTRFMFLIEVPILPFYLMYGEERKFSMCFYKCGAAYKLSNERSSQEDANFG